MSVVFLFFLSVGYPFGGTLYVFVGQTLVFMTIAVFLLLDLGEYFHISEKKSL